MGRSLESQLASLAGEYRLEVMYAFGSRSKEIARRLQGAESPPESQSDVDIGVQPFRGEHLTARDRVRITLALEELLDLPRVDLVIVPEADPFLAAEVVRGELLWAADLDAEAETQLHYLRRAGDLAPFFRQRWQDLMGSEL